MKDTGTKVEEDESKVSVKEEEKEKENNIDEKELNAAPEDVDVDKLTDNVKELNINPESDKKDDGDDLVKRGPDGGIPSQRYMEKTVPMGPYGNYQPPNSFAQIPNNNGRRGYEPDECEPGKYRRGQPQAQPQIPNFQPMMQGGQPMVQGGFPFNNFNNLSGNDGFNQVFTHNTSLSGGNVIINSPPPNQPSIVDAFLDDYDKQSRQMQQPNIPAQPLPQYQSDFGRQYQSPNPQDDFVMSPTSSVVSVNMKSPINDGRRPSDPLADSGVESAEEKSPYSDSAPSPTGSNYSYPPSVESGYGRSPKHETVFGQTPTQMPQSQYPGIMSPRSNRLTPSPASSAGYYSPKSQIENEDFFANPETEESLRLAMEVIGKDILESCTQKAPSGPPLPAYPIKQSPPRNGNLPMNMPMQQNQMFQQKQPLNVQQPIIPQQGFQPSGVPVQLVQPGTAGGRPQQAPVPPNMLPAAPITTTTAVAPQSIIIVQQPPQTTTNSTAPFIVLTQVPNKPPEKLPRKPRKILPKGSVTGNVSTTSGTNNGGITTTSQSSRANIMAPREGVPVNSKMGQQPNVLGKQDRLLMIGRRTVAGMTDDELKKSDDEGDTYLHIAVCKTDKHMVQALLERLHRQKLDHLVDQENNKRQTPLYLAVYINQPVMVAMFIKFQANVNVLAQSLSSDGMTREVKAAIHVASSQGHEYVDTLQQLLLAKDISINIVNNYGQTALHCAIAAHNRVKRNSEERINSLPIITMLIKAGADVSAQDQKSGKTPLMYAIEQRDLQLVETILSCIEPSKMRNVVRTQAFDGSSCLKIAEGLKDSYNIQAWNRLWNSLQSAASGTMRIAPTVF